MNRKYSVVNNKHHPSGSLHVECQFRKRLTIPNHSNKNTREIGSTLYVYFSANHFDVFIVQHFASNSYTRIRTKSIYDYDRRNTKRTNKKNTHITNERRKIYCNFHIVKECIHSIYIFKLKIHASDMNIQKGQFYESNTTN